MSRRSDPLSAIGEAVALLRQSGDPAVRAIGDWIATGTPGNIMSAIGERAEPGYSARLGAALPERDRLIGQLAAPGYSAARVARDLDAYRTDQWPQIGAAPECPHQSGSREATMWRIFQCRDHPLSVRQVQSILTRSARANRASGSDWPGEC